jgi:hypothetical protein
MGLSDASYENRALCHQMKWCLNLISISKLLDICFCNIVVVLKTRKFQLKNPNNSLREFITISMCTFVYLFCNHLLAKFYCLRKCNS